MYIIIISKQLQQIPVFQSLIETDLVKVKKVKINVYNVFLLYWYYLSLEQSITLLWIILSSSKYAFRQFW